MKRTTRSTVFIGHTGRVHPWIGSGRDVSGSGRVQILDKSGGSGRVGSDYSKCPTLAVQSS